MTPKTGVRAVPPPGGPTGWLTLRALLLCVCCVGASVRLGAAQQCPDGTPPPCGPRGAARATAPARNSVAVLYFENLSRDASDAYLADGYVTPREGYGQTRVAANQAPARDSSNALGWAMLANAAFALELDAPECARRGARGRTIRSSSS